MATRSWSPSISIPRRSRPAGSISTSKALAVPYGESFDVEDLLTGTHYAWHDRRTTSHSVRMSHAGAHLPPDVPVPMSPQGLQRQTGQAHLTQRSQRPRVGGVAPLLRIQRHLTIQTNERATNVKKSGSATDPLWYKDAIIYELHVRAFADSNARRNRRLRRSALEARITCRISASPVSGCFPSFPRPCGTMATTSPTTPASTPATAPSTTSSSSSTPPMSATCRS